MGAVEFVKQGVMVSGSGAGGDGSNVAQYDEVVPSVELVMGI